MANSLNRLTIKEDPWELKERTRKGEEMEDLNKKQVEEFKRLKSAQQCSSNLETVPTQKDESGVKLVTGGPGHLNGGGVGIRK